MKIKKPWGINRISDMVSARVRTQRDGNWVLAVPMPYQKNIRERIRAAWWVFTGKAEAVIWPEAGDLEEVLIDEGLSGEPLELPYKNWRGDGVHTDDFAQHTRNGAFAGSLGADDHERLLHRRHGR